MRNRLPLRGPTPSPDLTRAQVDALLARLIERDSSVENRPPDARQTTRQD